MVESRSQLSVAARERFRVPVAFGESKGSDLVLDRVEIQVFLPGQEAAAFIADCPGITVKHYRRPLDVRIASSGSLR